MYGVNLINASLTHAILDGGKLIHANLNGANCTKGSFRDVDFTNSSLRKARFEQADLHYAVLAACDLQKCDFTEAILSGANMDGALTNDAVFLGTLWAPAGSGADDETNMLAQFYGWIYSHQLLFVKIVRRSGTTPGYKTADDVISETAVSLAASRLLPQIMSMDDVQRTRFFSQELRRMTRAQGAQTSDISLDQFDDEELGYSFDPETEEETAVMLDEEVERVSQIASRILAPQTWRILQSRFVLGDSISNIAKQEGISARTVQRHITKGRELLRAELK
jgi:RNA polymerase sigma factor (sigma-70 family)